MSEIFGKTARREDDNENDFPPSQTQNEEVEEQDQEPNTQSQESTGEIEQGNVPEEQTGQSGQSDSEEKQEKLLGKFNDRSSLLESVKNLGDKLGKNVDPAKAIQATDEELVKIYQDLESQLGHTSDVDKTRQENQQLKSKLSQYEQQLQQTQQQMTQMQRYLQNMNQQQNVPPQQQDNQNAPQQNKQEPQRNPTNGRFESNQNNQQTNNQQTDNQQPDNQQQEEKVDPDKFLRDFYNNPVEAIKKINNMDTREAQQVKNNMNQQQRNDFNQQERQIQQQKSQQYRQQLNNESQDFFKQKRYELEDKYEEFKDPETKKKVVKYMQDHPVYLNPRIFPNGLERAYLEVKKMEQGSNQNNNTATNKEQVNENLKAQKQAAGLPKSQGSYTRTQDNSNDTEQLKDDIFGTGGGIFGR
jgi:hypothetical protein